MGTSWCILLISQQSHTGAYRCSQCNLLLAIGLVPQNAPHPSCLVWLGSGQLPLNCGVYADGRSASRQVHAWLPSRAGNEAAH